MVSERGLLVKATLFIVHLQSVYLRDDEELRFINRPPRENGAHRCPDELRNVKSMLRASNNKQMTG